MHGERPPTGGEPASPAGLPPLGSAAHTPEVPWGFLDAVAVFVLASVATVVAGVVLLEFVRDTVSELAARLVSLPLSLVVLAATVLAWVRLRFPGTTRLLRGRRPAGGGDLLVGAGVGLGAFVVLTLGVGFLLELAAQRLGVELPVVQEEFRRLAADPSTFPVFALSAGVVAPVTEELFFRGLLYQGLRRRLGVGTATLLSALLFALLHGTQPTLGGNILVVAFIFPLGVLLAWLFQRRGTLLVPIAAHATYNLVQVIALFLFGEHLMGPGS